MTAARTLADWIATTTMSRFIQDASWVVPSVQTVHILAIGVLMTCIGMFNAKLAGLIDRQMSFRVAADAYVPPVWWALAVLAFTGLVLVIGEPHRELENQLFLVKMVLVLLSVAMTVATIKWSARLYYSALPGRTRLALMAIAILSTTAWLLILCCGRWIAYIDAFGQ